MGTGGTGSLPTVEMNRIEMSEAAASWRASKAVVLGVGSGMFEILVIVTHMFLSVPLQVWLTPGR